MIKKLILLFLLITTIVCQAQTPQELFASANNLYKEGKYNQAIALYNQIIATEKVSSELYYNLGNSYYKLNQVAPTIYNYEKALQLNPLNKDAQNNLIFAKRLTLDRIEEIPKSIIQKLNQNYLQKLTYNSWAWVTVVISFMVAIFFFLYYFSQTSNRKRLFFVVSIVSFLLLLITLTITVNQYSIHTNKVEAIIFAEEVAIKNAPTFNSDTIFTLHEGTKVNVLDSIDSWKKIKLADGKIGWIKNTSLKLL